MKIKFEVIVGECVRNKRKKLEWSQEQLAHKSNLSLGYISLIELGKTSCSVNTLFKIIHAFNIPPLEFLRELDRISVESSHKR